MNPARLAVHVRRYPRWYAVAVGWLALMVVLPTVGVDVVPAFATPAPAQQPVASAPAQTPTSPSRSAVPGETGATAAAPDPEAPATSTTSSPPPIDTEPPEIVPPEELPPDFFDPVFDAIPGLPAIDTPPELMPLFRAVAPIAGYGCSATGLASLVLAVVAPSVEDVPVERILPYLAPVTSACANFPIPETHTVCALDEPLVIDLGGLTNTPPVIGVGIDVIEGIERELVAAFGGGAPQYADMLRETLDCRVVTD